MKTLFQLEIKELPPTVNLMHIHAHGRRIKTPEYRNFQERVTTEIKTLWRNKPPFKGRAALLISFFTNNRRHWDIDNRVKALQDCLTFAGVIQDDSQIDLLHVERVHGAEENSTRIMLNELLPRNNA